MKSTGIIRKIDELGRITIPCEMRTQLNLYEGEKVEIWVDRDSIILKKPINCCCLCNKEENLIELKSKMICESCINSILKLSQ